MVEIEIRSLRAQLNPHFIFNTMGSIQNLIATKRTALANDYLADLAGLMRKVLKYTKRGIISLEEELDLLRNLQQDQPGQKRIALPTQQEITLVKVAQIVRCQGENNYAHFYLKDGRHILVSRPIGEYEELLEPNGFIRTHQSHLANLAEVRSFVKSDGGYLLMETGAKVAVSRYRKDKVLEALLG
ncbi:MAG: histidine kinase [Saprospiraceae bacterium]|nr:histidine kinase [Lewinella sp.]